MIKEGYELQRLVSKLRIRGLNIDADKLEKDHCINFLSREAITIIQKERR